MPKLIVAINVSKHFKSILDLQQELASHRNDYFPMPDKSLISLDEAHLQVDPTETSFRLFEFIGYKE